MTFEEFNSTLTDTDPPAKLNDLLKSLWFDGRGDWEAAHDIAQEIHDKNGSWIHAYLHRKEGDINNAAYWYRRAGKLMPQASLKEEWNTLVKAFLE
jgi:hypothetical protein